MQDSFVPLIQFFATTGEVVGRKKCQKMVHILQECGFNFGVNFELALYGAFSSDLQFRLEELINDKYIIEKPTSSAGFNTSCFTPNKSIGEILDVLEESHNPVWADMAKQLNEKSPRELETTSTIMFLRSSGVGEERLKIQFEALKPKLKNLYSSGLAFADELKSTNAN